MFSGLSSPIHSTGFLSLSFYLWKRHPVLIRHWHITDDSLKGEREKKGVCVCVCVRDWWGSTQWSPQSCRVLQRGINRDDLSSSPPFLSDAAVWSSERNKANFKWRAARADERALPTQSKLRSTSCIRTSICQEFQTYFLIDQSTRLGRQNVSWIHLRFSFMYVVMYRGEWSAAGLDRHPAIQIQVHTSTICYCQFLARGFLSVWWLIIASNSPWLAAVRRRSKNETQLIPVGSKANTCRPLRNPCSDCLQFFFKCVI